MQKLVILQGIPASGKSTYAKKLVNENPNTHVRVCRDDLRRMRGIYLINDQEKMITDWEMNCIICGLNAGLNVVVDATNLNPKTLKRIEDLAAGKSSIEIEKKLFNTPLEECIARDLKRGEYSVGEAVIKDFYYKYMVDKVETAVPSYIIQDPKLAHAIICDLDGTMCIHNGRGPFEYGKCDTDLLNEAVATVVRSYCQHNPSAKVIYMSGREDFCREKSQDWLIKHNLFQGFLYMRPTGDHRKDVVIKKELFDQHIKGVYFVDFCLDDRDQVVKLWRDLGLSCLQVNYGDF